jgi:hypothetical protein
MKQLHIFGQSGHGDTAYIIGTRAALVAIRNALNVAIDRGASAADAAAADGEEYQIRIYCRHDMSDVPMPYVDIEDDTPWPEWL